MACLATCTYAQLTLESTATARGLTVSSLDAFATIFTFVPKHPGAPLRRASVELMLHATPFDSVVSYVSKPHGGPFPTGKPNDGGKVIVRSLDNSVVWASAGSTISVTESVMSGDIRLVFEHRIDRREAEIVLALAEHFERPVQVTSLAPSGIGRSPAVLLASVSQIWASDTELKNLYSGKSTVYDPKYRDHHARVQRLGVVASPAHRARSLLS